MNRNAFHNGHGINPFSHKRTEEITRELQIPQII
jgi:hypothetical protein